MMRAVLAVVWLLVLCLVVNAQETLQRFRYQRRRQARSVGALQGRQR